MNDQPPSCADALTDQIVATALKHLRPFSSDSQKAALRSDLKEILAASPVSQPAAAPADDRVAIEAWAVAQGHDVERRESNPDLYEYLPTPYLWTAWQAARAAALPAASIPSPDDDILCVCGWENWRVKGYVDRGTAERRYQLVAGYVLSKLALQPAQADAQAETREPIAWVTDDDRAITAAQKQHALADGGATASSVRPYSIPCYAGSAPADAGEARLTDSQREAIEFAAKTMDERRLDAHARVLRALLNGADHDR
ncbi:hypothetical protein [Burkholderia cepacia]|uniref:Uncharacterized protein n=1 Tax=Burkholderia cepacia TaxID=292 RepID=A0AA88Z0D7_BURCE|nr:hypothetical protein [Burkholderia cepacia]KGB98485.1 hypothetical protein DM43_3464 [Burkholderia cepacia]